MADTTPQAAAVPRLFHLQRSADVTGVSGTGRVADGVLWPDGTVTVRWCGNMPSTAMWGSLDHARTVHGHGGATSIVFDDETVALPKDLRAALRKVGRMISDSLTESAAQGQRISVLIDRAESIRDLCFTAANGGEW
jgi:hypothetical protein